MDHPPSPTLHCRAYSRQDQSAQSVSSAGGAGPRLQDLSRDAATVLFQAPRLLARLAQGLGRGRRRKAYRRQIGCLCFASRTLSVFAVRVCKQARGNALERRAFAAPDRASVDAFYREALKAGVRDAGPPGPRPQYSPTYYGAFVFDPDGKKIEAVTDP